jgi:hypothetical protein
MKIIKKKQYVFFIDVFLMKPNGWYKNSSRLRGTFPSSY